MRTLITAILTLILAFGITPSASANCADDAIDTCNAKHPDPDKSDHAYELYELCIKAQIGQNCPNSAIGTATIRDVERTRAGQAPRCAAGYTLKPDWKGNEDWCIRTSTRFTKRAAHQVDKATPILMQPTTKGK